MKRLVLIAVALLSALPAVGQVSLAIPNDTSTGTTLNKIAKLNITSSATSMVNSTTINDAPVAICTQACGTSGTGIFTFSGTASCLFVNATTPNDYVQVDPSTSDCKDVGSSRPTSGVIIGTVFGAGGAAGTYTVYLDKSIFAASSGGAPAVESWYGDGSDGAVTADGSTTVTCLGAPTSSTYTMTRDCYFTTLTINSSVIVKNAGFRILAQTSITSTGTIRDSGGAGGAGGNASGTNSSTGGTLGSGGTDGVGGSLATPPGVGGGKAGTTGTTGAGTAGSAGSAGSGATAKLQSVAGAGAAGGNGGTGSSGAGGTGGAGGTVGAGTVTKDFPHEAIRAACLCSATGNLYQSTDGNGGGGSGASGGGDGTNNGGGGGGSGGNGGHGGNVVLISPTITLNSSSVIDVSGGTGANGGHGGTPTTGNCGGGGGGAGGSGGNAGVIARVYQTLTNNGTDTITGGNGGTGGALGSGVGTGTAGTAGSTGTGGGTGLVFNIQLP